MLSSFAMRSLLSSTTARLAASIVGALGLAPLAACDSDVTTTADGGGGSTSSRSTSSFPSGPGGGDGGSGDGGAYPDHPPTCEELSTSAQTSTGAVGTTGPGEPGAGGSGGSGGGASVPVCENPDPVLVGCLDTGVDVCDGGWLVRREAVACPAWHRPASEFSCSASPDVSEVGCTTDSDCGAGSRCDQYFLGPPAGDACQCVTTCETDSDCGAGKLCLCGEAGGSCVDATCSTDADCGAGLRCASYQTGDPCDPTVGFACQTAADQCITGGDCLRDATGDMSCNVDASGSRVCEGGGGCMAAGRPLVVDGRPRLAGVAERADWLERASVGAPSAHDRPAIAAGWAHIAAMEHASVASFARFAMDLLSLGAPPDLIHGAARAMAEETEHARLAFGLATAFGGSAMGPARLDVAGALGATDLVELAVATFLEGCIAEGIASAEAAIAATYAVDPAVRAVQERIAIEEGHHAELGWKTIAWALRTDPRRVAPALRAALARAEAEEPPRGLEPGLEAWGLLGPQDRAAVRSAMLRTVVRPILERVLEGAARADTSHAGAQA